MILTRASRVGLAPLASAGGAFFLTIPIPVSTHTDTNANQSHQTAAFNGAASRFDSAS
jgi:hypothetical protein